MITTKQRAMLRKLANTIEPSMQIGKEGTKDTSIKQVKDMLEARELVKIKVLANLDTDIKVLANEIAEKLACDIVQVIGNKMVFYARSSRKDVKHIELV